MRKGTSLFFLFILIQISLLAAQQPSSPPPGYQPTEGSGTSGNAIIQIKGKIVENIKGKFSATFQSTPVKDVFRIFGIQSGLNILVSPKISANVTANFKNVPIKDAFLAILSANNLYYLEQGSIVKILTLSEYKNGLQQSFLETRSYDASVIDLKNFATIIKPFLTPGLGHVTVDAQSSKILVTDIKDNFKRIDNLYKEISSLPKMVEIQTKIIEVTLNDKFAEGVNLKALKLGKDVTVNFTPTPTTGVDNESVNVSGTHAFTPSTTSLEVFLSMMKSILDTRVISQPTVLAMNRQEAEILIGGKVPYISSTSTSTTTSEVKAEVKFAEIGLKIVVTPVVTPDGRIKMKIYVSQSTSTLINVDNNQKAPNISTSEVKCEAVAQSGHSIVIGGLIKTEKTKTVSSIPILGQIPILKYLFSYTSDSTRKDELIIILTPKIINPGESNYQPSIYSKEVNKELKEKKNGK